jgi:hypothetical protein
MTWSRLPLIFFAFMIPALVQRTGAAQTRMPDDRATEQALALELFQQGRVLMNEGRLAEACPKFAESQHLDPAGGTLINLALCYEKSGKTASAWAVFEDAQARAKQDGRADRIRFCREHMALLEPTLVHLQIELTSEPEGLSVQLDGRALDRALWGRAVPVDPGTHVVLVAAPGHEDWRQEVTAGPTTTAVVVPALLPRPALVRRTPESESPTPSRSQPEQPSAPQAPPAPAHRFHLGPALLGVGAAVLAVGALFGVRAIQQAHAGNRDAFQTSAWIADIGIGLGLASVGTGTFLIVSSTPARDTRLSLSWIW